MRSKKGYTLTTPQQIYTTQYVPCVIPVDSLQNIRSKTISGYRVKTIIAGPYIESEIYPIWQRRSSLPRAPKANTSKAAQVALNDKNAIKRITRLVNANFDNRDLWATYTYAPANMPGSMEAAQRNIQNFIRRLKHAYQSANLPALKYLYVTERTEKTSGTFYHHHFVVSGGLDRDIIEQLWRGMGRTQTRRLQPDEHGLTGLAKYISKAPTNGAHRWAASKNLKKPIITTADCKTTKSKVYKAARDYEALRAYFERLYLGCQVTDIANPMFNDLNGGVYLQARMRRCNA